MNNRFMNIVWSFCSLCTLLQTNAQERYSLNSENQTINWFVRAFDKNEVLDQPFDAQDWVKAMVPGTFFVDFVNAGVEMDPNFGDNIYHVDREKYNRDYIYRTEFVLPGSYTNKGMHIWLNFEGINRRGVIYLNGSRLDTLRGMMMRGHYDITTQVRKKGSNILQVVTSVPNQHRHPEEKFANMASPTYMSSAGWDWMPNVPGLNCGITDDVYLTCTGDLTIKDMWIRSKLRNQNRSADIEISAEIENLSSKSVIAEIRGVILPGEIQFQQEVVLKGNTVQTVVFNSRNVPSLMLKEPKLWWPNGLGDPNLYECKLSVSLKGEISDCKTDNFGIREYDYRIDENGVFNIYVNGERTFIKGGNWGMSEYLLRCRGKEYDTKVRLHKEMNFNIIRNWMGSVTDNEFYDACDRYGIMVWDDFWLNSKIGLPEYPDDFNKNAVEKIKRFRNHPSIVVWCGENEGIPGRYESGESLDENLAEFVAVYDACDRHYQSNSRKGNGLSGSGLWKNYAPEFYFADASNSILGDKYPKDRGWGFRSEIGTAVFTTFESFKEFMPEDSWWPRSEMWNKHFFGSLAKNGGPDVYEHTIIEKYGQPKGIEDFCEKAQLVNLETNKAMFEAWSSKMWNDASGIMIWMSQSAYPSFVWQTYDYYYDLTGAYWGAKKGCEPLHILWDSHVNEIKVTNSTHQDYEQMTATAMIFDRHGKQIKSLRKSTTLTIPANSSTTCFRILSDSISNKELTDVNFLRLSLKGEDGKTISSNDYWFGRDNDCLGLNTLPKAYLTYYISRREVKNGRYYLDLRISNKGETPAFALRCRLIEKESSKRILPVIQSENYITLMPGEVKTVFFEFEDSSHFNQTSVQACVKQYGYTEEIID